MQPHTVTARDHFFAAGFAFFAFEAFFGAAFFFAIALEAEREEIGGEATGHAYLPF